MLGVNRKKRKQTPRKSAKAVTNYAAIQVSSQAYLQPHCFNFMQVIL